MLSVAEQSLLKGYTLLITNSLLACGFVTLVFLMVSQLIFPQVGKDSGHSYKLTLSCGMLTNHSAFQMCTVSKFVFISSMMSFSVSTCK